MKIVVCIKPVRTDLVYPNESRNERFVINPYDLLALQNAVELKNKVKAMLICVCMGASGAEEVLIKALALGADETILLSDTAFGGADTVATTYILAKAIQKIGGVDIVMCGKKSVDGETGQVVFGIAERLNLLCMTQVDHIIELSDSKITLRQKCDNTLRVLCIPCPAVVVFSEFTTNMGKISLLALKKAKKKGITVWNGQTMNLDLDKCGVTGSKTKVLNIHNELVNKQGVIVQGDTKEKANFILKLLFNRKVGDV